MHIHAEFSHFHTGKNKSIETHGAHAGARLHRVISSLEYRPETMVVLSYD